MRRWSLIATAAQRLRYSQPSEPLGRLYVTVDPCPDRCCDLPPRRDRGGDGRNLRCTALAALRSELCLHYPMGCRRWPPWCISRRRPTPLGTAGAALVACDPGRWVHPAYELCGHVVERGQLPRIDRTRSAS